MAVRFKTATPKEKANIERFVDALSKRRLLGAMELYAGFRQVTDMIKKILSEFELSVSDLDAVIDYMKITGIMSEWEEKILYEETPESKIQRLSRDYTILEGVSLDISEKARTTDVWRLITGLSAKTGKPSHVYAVQWRRKGSGKDNRGTGHLFVAFRDGGGVKGGTVPVYVYSGVSYDDYYYIWKQTGSPGTVVYYNLGGEGEYVGSISETEVQKHTDEEIVKGLTGGSYSTVGDYNIRSGGWKEDSTEWSTY